MGRDCTELLLPRLFRQLRVQRYAPLRVFVQAGRTRAGVLCRSYTLSPEKVQVHEGYYRAQETSTRREVQVRRDDHRLKSHVPEGLHNPLPSDKRPSKRAPYPLPGPAVHFIVRV
jgi:hypothetical protein